MKYDYLIVGAGLFGATFCDHAKLREKKCLVIDKRGNIGGNIYTKNIENINVHEYGAHIFHTGNEYVWKYINKFANFNNYINTVIADYNGERYNLPFNMNTFKQLWGIATADEAKSIIQKQIKEANIKEINNLEDQAISMVGIDVYNKLIKGYTEKQWGKSCKDLPSFIIKRLPLRFEFNNNYFNDKYQGIPIGGYTKIIEQMLEGSKVLLNTDYKEFIKSTSDTFDKIIYTGKIDEFFDYKFGRLQYRSLKFDTRILNQEDYQGNAVVNYTSCDVPYTRIIEHKYFEDTKSNKTIISIEYPDEYNDGKEAYYTINDDENNELAKKYRQYAENNLPNVMFGGRLGEYKYYDMDKVILSAHNLAKREGLCEDNWN